MSLEQFNWGDDIIDSRKINSRYDDLKWVVDELLSDISEAKSDIESFMSNEDQDNKNISLEQLKQNLLECENNLIEFNQSYDKDELDSLIDIIKQGESFSGWHRGVELIHINHFETYAKQLQSDDCQIDVQSLGWPYNHMEIDWESAISELQSGYSVLEALGETYYLLD